MSVDKAGLFWYNQLVDMPTMGPGANKAGWWVEYLEELVETGKYEIVLHFLGYARRHNSLETINKAKEELLRERGKRKSGVHKVDVTVGHPSPGSYSQTHGGVNSVTCVGPGIKKVAAPAMKDEPYFFSVRKGA